MTNSLSKIVFSSLSTTIHDFTSLDLGQVLPFSSRPVLTSTIWHQRPLKNGEDAAIGWLMNGELEIILEEVHIA
jgi:hypothetical protein